MKWIIASSVPRPVANAPKLAEGSREQEFKGRPISHRWVRAFLPVPLIGNIIINNFYKWYQSIPPATCQLRQKIWFWDGTMIVEQIR
jgi:hypothetical protein